MKSFKTYLKERKGMVMTSRAGMNKTRSIDGWTNPGVSELMGALKRSKPYYQLRFLVAPDGKNSYYWNADDAIHLDVEQGEDIGTYTAWGMIWWKGEARKEGHFEVQHNSADAKILNKNATLARIKSLDDTVWEGKRTVF